MKKLLAVLMVLFSIATSYAANYEVTLNWDRVVDTDLAGYRVLYSNMSGTYDRLGPVAEIPLDKTSTIVTVPEVVVTDGSEVVYSFVVVAFDWSQRESGFSPEAYFITKNSNIIFVEDNKPPAAPGGCYISAVRKIN